MPTNKTLVFSLIALTISSCATQRTAQVNTPLKSVIEQPKPTIVEQPKSVEKQPATLPTEAVSENTEKEQNEEYFEIPTFTYAQTSSVTLPEHKKMTMDDMTIALTQQNAHYPADGHVTSPYGWRHGRMHSGLDIKAQTGDNIYAFSDGVVRFAKYNGAYGNCIVIHHFNGLETLYGHSSRLLVKPNDVVRAGDVIAYAGNTGRSTGSHLHFEVRVSGQCVDPNLFVDAKEREIDNRNVYLTMRGGLIYGSNIDDETKREAEFLALSSVRYYTVKSGDILSRIAARNNTTVTKICQMNGILSRSILRIGQRLKVKDGVEPAKKATSNTTAVAKSESVAPSKNTTTGYYTIKSGDTLSSIASRNGTTVSKICALNNISSRATLQIGQRLAISGSSSSANQSNDTNNSGFYTVKSGDTLSAIASRNGTTVSQICNKNGISSRSTLNIGQRLKL